MPAKKVRIWKTKDGREMPMTEMTDSHLNNAIASYERGVIENQVRLIEDLVEKIENLEDTIDTVRYNINIDAQMDYESARGDIQLAEAMAPGYNAAIEPYLNRLEQLKNKLELLHVGDPRGILGYDELIEERNSRKGM